MIKLTESDMHMIAAADYLVENDGRIFGVIINGMITMFGDSK